MNWRVPLLTEQASVTSWYIERASPMLVNTVRYWLIVGSTTIWVKWCSVRLFAQNYTVLPDSRLHGITLDATNTRSNGGKEPRLMWKHKMHQNNLPFCAGFKPRPPELRACDTSISTPSNVLQSHLATNL